MISNFEDALIGDVWKRFGCLVAVLTLIVCLHYYRCRLQQDSGDNFAVVAETMGAVFSGQRAVEEEIKPVTLDNKNTTVENRFLAHLDEREDNVGFAYYDGRGGVVDEDNDLLQQEVVEITFDFGIMEGNIRRFLSRMNRVII